MVSKSDKLKKIAGLSVILLYNSKLFCRTNRLYVQVGGAVVVFEVQRSSRSEARKEEARKQELEVHRILLEDNLLPH